MKKCITLPSYSSTFFFFFFFSFSFVCAKTHEDRCIKASRSHSYLITKSPYTFSTYFEMQGEDRYEGRVIKDHVSIRTVYDLYDPFGTHEAQGVCQVLSLGSLYPWAKDIDIYDIRGRKIGFIDGEFFTISNAKYSFYDWRERLVAIAYLDNNCSGFTIMAQEENERTIALLKRNFIQNDVDSWSISLYDPTALDPRILKIFSAFVSDSQEFFKDDL